MGMTTMDMVIALFVALWPLMHLPITHSQNNTLAVSVNVCFVHSSYSTFTKLILQETTCEIPIVMDTVLLSE